jgi:hypothetical protein
VPPGSKNFFSCFEKQKSHLTLALTFKVFEKGFLQKREEKREREKNMAEHILS